MIVPTVDFNTGGAASIDSTPMQTLPTVVVPALEVLADFRFEALFRLLSEGSVVAAI